MLLLKISCIISTLVVILTVVHADYFKIFEEMMKSEEKRRAESVLESDLLGGFDNPKDIEIHCPQVT